MLCHSVLPDGPISVAVLFGRGDGLLCVGCDEAMARHYLARCGMAGEGVGGGEGGRGDSSATPSPRFVLTLGERDALDDAAAEFEHMAREASEDGLRRRQRMAREIAGALRAVCVKADAVPIVAAAPAQGFPPGTVVRCSHKPGGCCECRDLGRCKAPQRDQSKPQPAGVTRHEDCTRLGGPACGDCMIREACSATGGASAQVAPGVTPWPGSPRPLHGDEVRASPACEGCTPQSPADCVRCLK